ncbi:MAG: YicC family protein [Lachnospiraceae bacterium]|nr:YicC family protein [Lachnospiraceae bacterium]
MINSMTGFGRWEVEEDNRRITVEIKAVNHRYLDINVRMPKKLGLFENTVRTLMKEYMQRGKVDVFITYEDCNETKMSLAYNESLAAEYVKYITQMAETFHLPGDLSAVTLSRCPEVLTMQEQDTDENELLAVLEKALRKACEGFVETRADEGMRLKADLMEKLKNMLSYVDFIEERSPVMLQEYRQRLEEKVKEILQDTQMDESRIATEITIFADKVCVDEETVRLRSHIKAMQDALSEGGSVGRKLDFIAQEMNREANTILSKSGDLAISDTGINLKTDIEKIREQIQNIE